jgi:Toprim domain-containing protein
VIGIADIAHATGGRWGRHDIACPLCGPFRRSLVNQRRRVMRIWQIEPGFATFHCVRCGEKGHARDRAAPPPNSAALRRAKAEAAERERISSAERLSKARWLWSIRMPKITGTIAEVYLREARGYGGPLPATLGLLPPSGKHGPAMIAAFGMAHEIEAGVIAIADDAVRGVHITRLLPDGSDRERGELAKIMVGHSMGLPIVLAPPNDLLGLAISEGIENGLSAYEVSGLGVWVAGSASRMPTLAEKVPRCIECISIIADADGDGRRFADDLADRLVKIGFPDLRVQVCGDQDVPTNASKVEAA